MKRKITGVIAGSLLVMLFAAPALAQKIRPVGPGTIHLQTPDGATFTFGASIDFQPMTLRDLNFNRNLNFRGITEFGALGQENDVIGFENRLFFTASKGRLSLYTAIELDGTLDEREADANTPDIERLNISLLVPEVNTTFTVGFDVYAVDPIGGLVYIDDDPGVWFKGGAGPWSWQVGWHKRLSFGGAAGDSGGGKLGAEAGGRFEDKFGLSRGGGTGFVPFSNRRASDTDIFDAKVGYDLTHPFGRLHLEPFAIFYLRNSPMTGTETNRLGCVGPGGIPRPGAVTVVPGNGQTCTGAFVPGVDPLQASINKARIQPSQETWYAGLQAAGNIGWLRPSWEAVGLFGHIKGLRDRVNGSLPFGHKAFDILSMATYLRLDFDWSRERWWPLRAVIPFVSAEFLKGDPNPGSGTLQGFVSPSTPNALRPGDFPFLRKTVLGLGGSPLFGNGTSDFGFAVDGRGIGPTIGNITEGFTFGSAALFNNRFGKGDNPGYLKLSTGLQGSWNPQWDFHLVGNFLRFHETAPVEAEFRSFGGPTSVVDPRPFKISSELGGEINAMVVYKPAPEYQIRPFFSIFIPGAGAQALAGGSEPAIVSGVNFFAIF